MGSTGTADVEPGRRERKKLATRDAIHDAARELFATKGYENTTVGDIAEAADVAERTFYRHFASKEEVALAKLRSLGDDFAAALRQRPPSESPIEAVRAVAGELAAIPEPHTDFVEDLKLIDANPSVMAQLHRQLLDAQEQLTAEFAARLGVSTSALEPRLVAAAMVAVFQACARTWAANGMAGSPWDYAADAVDVYARGLDEIRRT